MTTNNEAFEKWFNSSMRDPTIGITETNIESACESAWQAATAEANKRIAELEVQLQNWKDFSKKVQKIDFNDYLELQASNNRLNEDLQSYAIKAIEIHNQDAAEIKKLRNILNSFEIHDSTGMQTLWVTNAKPEDIDEALSATPAESLQAHDDKDTERLNFLDKLQERATSDMKINMSLKTDIHINGSLGVSLYIRNYKGHTESTAYGKTIREAIDMALKEVK